MAWVIFATCAFLKVSMEGVTKQGVISISMNMEGVSKESDFNSNEYGKGQQRSDFNFNKYGRGQQRREDSNMGYRGRDRPSPSLN